MIQMLYLLCCCFHLEICDVLLLPLFQLPLTLVIVKTVVIMGLKLVHEKRNVHIESLHMRKRVKIRAEIDLQYLQVKDGFINL